jgi:hypothetical protein
LKGEAFVRNFSKELTATFFKILANAKSKRPKFKSEALNWREATTAVLSSAKYFHSRACKKTLRSLKQSQSGKETV